MKIIKGYLEYITENASRHIADYEMWDILKKGDALEIKEAIVQRPDFINRVDQYDHTPLWYAVRNGSFSLVKFMILKGAKVDHPPGPYADSPLSIAVILRKNDIVKLLLEKGAASNRVNKENDTLLHVAAEGRNLEIAELAISLNKESIGLQNSRGDTPLHSAFLGPRDISIEMIKLLLDNGADPNAKQTYSPIMTPLRHAVERASNFKGLENPELHREAIGMLIERGGDLLKAFSSFEELLKILKGVPEILPIDMETVEKKFRSREIRKGMF